MKRIPFEEDKFLVSMQTTREATMVGKDQVLHRVLKEKLAKEEAEKQRKEKERKRRQDDANTVIDSSFISSDVNSKEGSMIANASVEPSTSAKHK